MKGQQRRHFFLGLVWLLAICLKGIEATTITLPAESSLSSTTIQSSSIENREQTTAYYTTNNNNADATTITTTITKDNSDSNIADTNSTMSTNNGDDDNNDTQTQQSTGQLTSTATTTSGGSNEPNPPVIRPFYVNSNTLRLTADYPSESSFATIPDSGKTRQLPLYQDSTRVLSLQVAGVNGRYAGNTNKGLVHTHFQLWVDSRAVKAQGVIARISYDWSDDNVWDRIELYQLFATNDLPDYELYDSDEYLPTEITGGSYQNFTNGRIRVELWSTFPTCCPLYLLTGSSVANQLTFIQTPHLDITVGDLNRDDNSTNNNNNSNTTPDDDDDNTRNTNSNSNTSEEGDGTIIDKDAMNNSSSSLHGNLLLCLSSLLLATMLIMMNQQ